MDIVEPILTEQEVNNLIEENKQLRLDNHMQALLIDSLEKSNSEAWLKALAYAKEVDTFTVQAFKNPFCLQNEKTV